MCVSMAPEQAGAVQAWFEQKAASADGSLLCRRGMRPGWMPRSRALGATFSVPSEIGEGTRVGQEKSLAQRPDREW